LSCSFVCLPTRSFLDDSEKRDNSSLGSPDGSLVLEDVAFLEVTISLAEDTGSFPSTFFIPDLLSSPPTENRELFGPNGGRKPPPNEEGPIGSDLKLRDDMFRFQGLGTTVRTRGVLRN